MKKLKASPYNAIALSIDEESPLEVTASVVAGFEAQWPEMWPLYRKVLQMLFSQYEYDDLFGQKKTRVCIAKLIPKKKDNYGSDLLIKFSFDDTGITWDIFQKGMTIVHAQPAF